ncbi:Manganese ABC transporter substrate-binding lipoprotein [Candidatus Entotheonellaceae bacterium PAL068K]
MWKPIGSHSVRCTRVKRAAVVIAVTWLGLVPLSRPGPPLAAPSRLKVAATIFPLYDMVRQVAGPEVEVVLLVPPGASPHTFAARPGTVRALTGSAALFVIGHALDDWARRLAHGAGVPRTIRMDTQIPVLTWAQQEHEADEQRLVEAHAHRHGLVDPHYWLAIANAKRMVQHIADALGRLDSAGTAEYRQRATVYQTHLGAVDSQIRQLFAKLPRRNIATFHPAFQYFAAAYNLHVVATFEPTPGQEPAPQQVKTFLHQIEAHQLRVVFVEPQLPQAPLYGLARDLGVTLKELDPMGGGQGRDSYIAMMRFNATQIAAALRE